MNNAGPDEMPEPGNSDDGDELADLLAPYWSAAKTRNAIGVTDTQLAERIRAGEILAVTTRDGDSFYPKTQFEAHAGQVRVNAALLPFLTALRDHEGWTVGVLLHTPAPELDDQTPLQWVARRQDPHRLARYAAIVDAELKRR